MAVWERRAGEVGVEVVVEVWVVEGVEVLFSVEEVEVVVWVEVRFKEEERDGRISGFVDGSVLLFVFVFDMREVGGGVGGVMECQINVSTSNIHISLKHSPPSLPPNIISLLPTMFAVWYPLAFGLFSRSSRPVFSSAGEAGLISFQLILEVSETSKRHTSFSALTPSPPPNT